jgi:hypothetical protein
VNVAPGLDSPASCVAVAVDATSPDVVHVVYRLDTTMLYSSLSQYAGGNDAIVFATSADGGATWTRSPLMLGGVAGGPFGGHDAAGICPDVISPAKDAVVVEWPGAYAGDGNPDMYIFSDANRGAGFAAGTAGDGDYQANGETGALATVARDINMGVGQNGGSGDVTESPRLFTDGKGKTCLVWNGYGNNSSDDGVFVQCSSDLGKTFTAPLAVTKAGGTTNPHVSAGAIGPSGEIALVWHAEMDAAGTLLIATSTDGKTFTGPTGIPLYTIPDSTLTGGDSDVAFDEAGVLWVAYYAYDGGFADRIVVDKSCDGGKTWSGPVLVNGPEGSIAGASFPGLVVTKSAVSVHTFVHPGDVDGGGAQIARLVP